MYSISIISPHASDKAQQGRPGQRPQAAYTVAPPPEEEKRLNFRLKELLDYAGRVMGLEEKDDARKWKGVKGLMKRMRDEFPYLIGDDTCLELCYEDTLFGKTCEFQGPSMHCKRLVTMLQHSCHPTLCPHDQKIVAVAPLRSKNAVWL